MASAPSLAVGVLLLGACGTPAPVETVTPSAAASTASEASELLMFGGLGASASNTLPTSEGCMAFQGPLLDVDEGAQVTIVDGAGEVVAIAELGPAHVSEAGECTWLFTTSAPAGRGFYQARMGGWSSDVTPEADATGGVLTFNLADNPPS